MTINVACLLGVVVVATAMTGVVIFVSWWVDRLYDAKPVNEAGGVGVPKRLQVSS